MVTQNLAFSLWFHHTLGHIYVLCYYAAFLIHLF